MLNRIKRNALKRHTVRHLEKRDLSHRNSKLATLGFLVDESVFCNFEILYSLGNELGLLQKAITVFSFVEGNKKGLDERSNWISSNDFNWKGNIKNPAAEDFLKIPFDAFVAIYRNKNYFLDSLVAESASRFKIGFRGANKELFDLLLDTDLQDASLVKEEIKKYLKIFNKI